MNHPPSSSEMRIVPTDQPPSEPSTKVGSARPLGLLAGDTPFCPGCGEPIVFRLILEVLSELGVLQRSICNLGHGCYAAMMEFLDVELLQNNHGRGPSCATGIKRVRPESIVFSVQGDGDMVNEGLQDVLHTAARSERVTCILLNNGVFGDTGGQMTAATPVGQRTKTSLDGRDPQQHGYPIPIADLIARLEGAAYVARGSVHNAGAIAHTKRLIADAFRCQIDNRGFSFIEVLVMCPTGWSIPTIDGPDYMVESFGGAHALGVLKGDLSAKSVKA